METGESEKAAREGPAFLFDLDGTLVDSVYQHVLAWRDIEHYKSSVRDPVGIMGH